MTLVGLLMLLLAALAVAVCFLSFRSVNIRRRYTCSYAVVSGATNKIGTMVCKALRRQGLSVIAIGRDGKLLEALRQELMHEATPRVKDESGNLLHEQSRVLTLKLNARGNIADTFKDDFDAFAAENSIDKNMIGALFYVSSNNQPVSGYNTPRANTVALVENRFLSALVLSDYFYKLFLKRKVPGMKGAIVSIMPSANGITGANYAASQSAKTALTALTSALYIEGRSRGIDVLAVHPAGESDKKWLSRNITDEANAVLGGEDPDVVAYGIAPGDVLKAIWCSLGWFPHAHVSILQYLFNSRENPLVKDGKTSFSSVSVSGQFIQD